MRAFLDRFATGDEGTLGSLWTEDGFQCFSLELPWRQNQNGISCIPAGSYQSWWGWSPARKRMSYRLEKSKYVSCVPGRAGVLIHAGNFAGLKQDGWQQQVLGCILLGLTVGRIMNKHGVRQLAVLHSMQAIADFESHMCREPFVLAIRNMTDVDMEQPHG